jgi:hypothetical protein
VVNLPGPEVTAPIATLLILPVVAGFTTSVPLPVGLIETTALSPFNVTLPVAVSVVTVTAAGVILPIVMLLIAPVVLGAIVTVPVPLGVSVTVELTGLRLTVLVAVNVVNVATFGELAPITTLFIAPVVVGLTVKLFVTIKSEIVPPVLNVKVLVVALVDTTIPLVPATVKLLLFAFKLIVSCPLTARYV